ncbi:acetyl-CoA carboxylase biotin carboxylase subunit family protein [Streptomyces bacillaris]|uniref:ATP-grasp domain-containing protein n=1 Tax=Streptomyces cavourensis TaxID=67258 RepID=A0AAD0VCW3_9ACTN|nr:MULTISPECIES: ATP-grasp domain-containing protein [Streptomyces]NUW20644.1 ATP-grasp domain-containing protein [Streptomyces roseoviolaceus]ATY94228.1 ATP-dependent carboxylate-amine ligase [Streptomyces cavourensis]AXI70058.1 ATP-grasp domain-containing protein [Streptomyces cavourensis]MBH0242336.1 ATP-grasp domain-containing protein [Streptomyces cavourensis]NUV39300.1 ATP-grasp domain-containing protein [Streptomyces sp. CAI-24]
MPEPSTPATGSVVMLGGRSEREFSVVRELGHRVVLLDERIPWHCMPWVDAHVDIGLDDWDAVADAIREELGGEPPAAVLTHTEPRLPLMAHLGRLLTPHAAGPGEEAVANCRDKLRTRTVLEAAGLPVPRFALATTEHEAVAVAARIGYPVVVKPRDGAGAFGVRCCTGEAEVRDAFGALGGFVADGLPGALIEEYVDGPEFAVQTLTRGGTTRVLSVFRQRTTRPPVFVELGYEYPCGLDAARREELDTLLRDALAALGLRDWISHTQVRLGPDGFRVIEVNARRPGGRLVEMTTAVSGVDMVEAVTRQVLGLEQPPPGPTVPFARYTSIVFDAPGTLLYDAFVPDGEGPGSPVVELEVAPGETVRPKEDPRGGVYGRIVVYGESLDGLDRAEQRVRQALDLQVVFGDGLDPAATDSREFKSCC